MRTFEGRLDILPSPQRTLLDELGTVSDTFVLYGGTALALRLGHRVSIDFDFFSDVPLDRRTLDQRLKLLRNAEVLDESAQGLTVSVDRDGPVKLSFFGGIDFGRVGQPEELGSHRIRVASLLDLGGTKLKALLQRVEAKDYLDVAALLRAGVGLPDILGSSRALFGPAFNPMVARKALTYFEGGDLAQLTAETRALLSEAALADVAPTPTALASTHLADA